MLSLSSRGCVRRADIAAFGLPLPLVCFLACEVGHGHEKPRRAFNGSARASGEIETAGRDQGGSMGNRFFSTAKRRVTVLQHTMRKTFSLSLFAAGMALMSVSHHADASPVLPDAS